jgi:hypothetical protein
LLAHGIDSNLLTDKSPRVTPLAMAQTAPNKDAIIEVLREAGAKS